MLPDITDFRWDERFAAMDAAIHLGRDPWRLLQPVLGHHAVTRAIQVFYTAGWLLALCSMPAIVAASRRLSHVRLRFFLTYAFCWTVLGVLLAGVFMSAGPIYYGEVTGDVARFAPQIDYLAFSQGAAHSSYDVQQTLWALHELDRVELGTGISAFPSLHVAMATLFMLVGWSVNRTWGIVGTVFLVLTQIGSVHLAWHYAVDGYFSFLTVMAVWFVLAAVERRVTRARSRA
jgi:hypothetical protein